MSKIHLRPATPADLPRMINILIASFAPGPWSRALFPSHLRTRPGDADETDWRLRVTAAQLNSPGHRHILAVVNSQTLSSSSSTPLQEEQTILGWAHWVDASRDPKSSFTPEEKRIDTERIWGSASPPGLDKAALEDMIRQGEQIEKPLQAVLNEDEDEGDGLGRRRRDIRYKRSAVELHYLMIDPAHQRKGVGRLLVQEGLDWAALEGKEEDDVGGRPRKVYLRSTAEGRGLYLSLGFKEVAEGTVFGQRQSAMVKTVGC